MPQKINIFFLSKMSYSFSGRIFISQRGQLITVEPCMLREFLMNQYCPPISKEMLNWR